MSEYAYTDAATCPDCDNNLGKFAFADCRPFVNTAGVVVGEGQCPYCGAFLHLTTDGIVLAD